MIKERHKNGYLKSTKTVVIQSYNFGELISKRKNKGFLWTTAVVPSDAVVSETYMDDSPEIFQKD